jgi:hypothetical protein
MDIARITNVCDYILTTNVEDLKNVRVKTPNYFDSDHQMVVGKLLLQTQKQHQQYTRNKSSYKLPIYLESNTRAEELFQQIYKAKARTKK